MVVPNGSEARQKDSPQRHRGTEAQRRIQRRRTSALSLPVAVFFSLILCASRLINAD
jgi:hypothetical protein